ncbi:MAG: 50S ribosomal protein L29 [Planctomycetota bacterium]|jgi:ribosomal protein L29|nr:MAG: 50S ribosomal protein L29 [Planctomycetota bacterium]
MKPAEVIKLSTDDLKVEATRLRRELFDLRCKSTTEKVGDNSRMGKARKDLARVLTENTARSNAIKALNSAKSTKSTKN